jgi:hypothetical protein
MKKLQFTYWQDGEFFRGSLNDHSDYQTQAYSKEELIENLKDLLNGLAFGKGPLVKKVKSWL